MPYPPRPTHYSLFPTPYAVRPTPYAQRPTPHTLYPTPCTPQPTPYTLRPTPHNMHPTPYTPHSTPCTLRPTPLPPPFSNRAATVSRSHPTSSSLTVRYRTLGEQESARLTLCDLMRDSEQQGAGVTLSLSPPEQESEGVTLSLSPLSSHFLLSPSSLAHSLPPLSCSRATTGSRWQPSASSASSGGATLPDNERVTKREIHALCPRQRARQ